VFPNPEPIYSSIINAVMMINSFTAFINASDVGVGVGGVGVASDVVVQAMINELLAAVWVRGYSSTSRYCTVLVV
jgi:hypothetical protein